MTKYKTNLTPGTGRKQSIRQRMKKIRASKGREQLVCDESVSYRPINVTAEEINIPSTSSTASPHLIREDIPEKIASTSSTYLQIEHRDRVPEQREILHTPTLQQPPREELQFKVTGRRIVNVKHFFNDVINFKHVDIFNCRNDHLEIVSEYRQGFRSFFTIKCTNCLEAKRVDTDPDPTMLNVNQAIVLGAISTGGGLAQIEEQFGICDLPVMSSHLYQKVQSELADCIHNLTWEVIEQAGVQERRIAVEKGHIGKDSIPYITVIADGAWSKRSYKVNYDAASGVGVIIGQETKKVLFLGIRNKYCCLCARAEKKEENKPHTCFKNWSGPSTGMESNIIVEGFKTSIEMHGLKYLYLVGDGDSSVTKKLADARPYDTPVSKIECRNHLLRNYCTRLRELTAKKRSAKNQPVNVKQRNVLMSNIKRLRSGVIGAINYVNTERSEECHSEKVRLLKKDIYNGPNHVFGNHEKCEAYFCSKMKNVEKDTDEDRQKEEYDWVAEMKASGLFQDIMYVAERVVRNAESLIQNMDNNAAECYNSVVAKFVGGKRINYTPRRSYTTRCEAAAISYNVPAGEFPRYVHKKMTHSSPGMYTKKVIERRAKNIAWKKSRRILFPGTTKYKRKAITQADEDYGLPSLDMNEDEYEAKVKEFLDELQMSQEECDILQKDTIGQADCLLWKEQRSNRLTASVFGQVCKQRHNTHCASLVKTILYSAFKGNVATNWGKEHEKIAINLYEEIHKVAVAECGLFVDAEKPYLAATPDGLIGDNGIIEVKCPYSAAKMTPIDAVKKKIIKFAELREGHLFLKRSSNYFYQVQGQLHITQRRYCIFIVWTPTGIESEVIFRDDEFWDQKMSKNLEDFFFKCLLPEIINPQHINNRRIKDLRR